MRKKHADETHEPDVSLTGRNRFIVEVFNAIIDRLMAELKRRSMSYKAVSKLFSFLNTIKTDYVQELRSAAMRLQAKYSGDLNLDFPDEIVHFQSFCRN